MDEAARGASALAAGDFEKAIAHYTAAISQNTQAVKYYIQRSIAYVRISDPASSLKDAEVALALASKRGSRELLTQSQLRRGIALFGLERWADAQECFQWVGKLDQKEKSVKIWEMKSQGKLKELAEDDERKKVTVEELPDVELPKAKEAKKAEKPATKKDTLESTSNGTVTKAGTEAKVEGVQTPADKIRHEWYQTTDTVVVTLFAKGIPKDKATIEIVPKSISVSFPLPTGSDFHFSLDPLFADIDSAASAFKIMSTKIEFTLKKKVLGQKWPSVEGTELVTDGKTKPQEGEQESSAVVAKSAGLLYPSSSKSGPKDWDKLANDLVKKPKKDKKDGEDDEDDGIDEFEDGDQVNGFFKNLYQSADPDTKRAMMKSYSESNGTALSTDWSSVSKAEVETSPPDGMEAKKW